MRFSTRIRLCFAAAMIAFVPCSAWAFKTESWINLIGCRGHFTASGSARYIRYRQESNSADREETIIEVKNVPLPPGTNLVVYITDEQVGTIKLDAKRGGSLVLKSSFGKPVPPIDSGSYVVVKTITGGYVLW